MVGLKRLNENPSRIRAQYPLERFRKKHIGSVVSGDDGDDGSCVSTISGSNRESTLATGRLGDGRSVKVLVKFLGGCAKNKKWYVRIYIC